MLKSIFFTKKIVEKKWDGTAIKKIKQEIEQEKNLVLKKWLLEKIAIKTGLP